MNLLTKIFRKVGNNIIIQPNFWSDYGINIKIVNHVWIGAVVNILLGITIGNNCVIGTVVTKNVKDNVVVVGNPCKIIKRLK